MSPVLPSCRERYRYAGPGVRSTKMLPLTTHHQVRYLPGLEFHRFSETAKELRIIISPMARVLYWEQSAGVITGVIQARFTVSDRSHSTTLELDLLANVLSGEIYYPFGGTAWQAGADRAKIRRYAGKERDVTGLYYYGFRYYAPWLLRWLNPDPAETVDGLNLLAFVTNNPLTWQDERGLMRRSASTQPSREQTQPLDLTVKQAVLPTISSAIADAKPPASPLLVDSGPEVSTSKPVTKSPSPSTQAHPINRNVKCTDPLCEQLFTTVAGMHRHLLAHTRGQRWRCGRIGCDKKFTLKRELLNHNRTHNINGLSKPYYCKECNSSFAIADNFTSHQIEIHNKTIACGQEGCLSRFTYLKDRQQHLLQQHLIPHNNPEVEGPHTSAVQPEYFPSHQPALTEPPVTAFQHRQQRLPDRSPKQN